MWSEAARSVWGKLDRETNAWMPLVIHLEDAHAVAGILWDEFLPRSTKQLLCELLHMTDEEGRALASWFAGGHDLGKASPAFAYKAAGAGASFVLDRMRDAGLAVDIITSRIGHATVGQVALTEWLITRHHFSPATANSWSCVIGGHHGRNPTSIEVGSARHSRREIGTGRWVAVREEILDTMTARTPVLRIGDWSTRRIPVPAQVLLTAIVVMADWIASNQDYFPYGDATTSARRADAAYERLGLPGPWQPELPADPLQLFRNRFPSLGKARPRPIQEALLQSALACESGSLHIVEEAMGAGKTEAALLATEALCARFGHGGMFIGLPTMATANPMFERTLNWLTTAIGQDNASVALAHGKAGLNERYAELIRQPWHGHIHDEDGSDRGQAIANSWLRGRRKAGLSSVVTGTIDQCLFLGLKAKHVALRHLAMAGKVVVIDEVHAADGYMREYLKRVLTWLGAYRTPVILMSATLPPQQRDEYVSAYAAGREDYELIPTSHSDAYPRITRYDGTLTDVPVQAADATTSSVSIKHIDDDPRTLASLLNELLADGGCAGIICNTVRRAQDMYRSLRERYGSDVVLMHSRFLAPHRATRERQLVAQLGRDGARPQRLIVVGTQVLEQSLDVDFDVMVTDLAPIDLVLQRTGRLHRHAGRTRPRRLTSPVLYLRGVEDWTTEPPVAVRGSRTIYGEASLLRAAGVLRGHDAIQLPAMIPSLVRQAYDPTFRPPDGWEERWKSADDTARRAQATAAHRAQTYLLAEPSTPINLTGWLDVDGGDPELDETKGRSQVRDSEDSLEVIALWRDEAGHLRLPGCAPAHPGALIPEGHPWGLSGEEWSIAKSMAACTISLPIQLTNERVIEKVIANLERSIDASGWQKSSWIAGQLVLAFDAEGRARVASYDLRYSDDEGLLVTESEETP